jgi:hypothetical protein
MGFEKGWAAVAEQLAALAEAEAEAEAEAKSGPL